jgi:hypothetical protein
MSVLPYANYVGPKSEEAKVLAIEEAQFHDLIRVALRCIEFDEHWYRQRYRDVDNAVAGGQLGSGFEHYAKVGYFEGRMPRQIVVDEDWYVESYTDVKGAIRRGKVDSAQEHFETYGLSEGRLAWAGWRL